MLSEFSVQNLGVIESAKLKFSPGFSVLTGETGAGKSLLLNGLKMLMGSRSDNKLVRHGAEKASVDGIWSIENAGTSELLKNKNVDLEENELFVSRTLTSDGKTRLTLGGRSLPLSAMSEISEKLVEIHGQSEQLKLKDPIAQRSILDAFGSKGISPAFLEYSEQYEKWRKLKRRIRDLEENSSKREIEIRYNRDLVDRFLALEPEEDEIEDIELKIEKISHIEDIAKGSREISEILFPEEFDGPISTLEHISEMLEKLSKYDSKLSEMSNGIVRGLSLLEQVTEDFEDYVNSIDLDSLRELHELEDRLSDLKIFAKPFGSDLNRAIKECLKAQEFLAENEQEIDLEGLQAERKEIEKSVAIAAKRLSEARSEAAQKLSSDVNTELAGLAMQGTEIVIEVNPKPASTDGADSVEFLIETKGGNRRPIMKAASGGELSRIMLALEVVAADETSESTLVFDEIDSGIGGATAIEVGRRLAKLSQKHQVIVVSHLPQVSCWAETHYVISKDSTGNSVFTTVEKVEKETRVKEIARMLSGLSESETGISHAEELLEMAQREISQF